MNKSFHRSVLTCIWLLCAEVSFLIILTVERVGRFPSASHGSNALGICMCKLLLSFHHGYEGTLCRDAQRGLIGTKQWIGIAIHSHDWLGWDFRTVYVCFLCSGAVLVVLKEEENSRYLRISGRNRATKNLRTISFSWPWWEIMSCCIKASSVTNHALVSVIQYWQALPGTDNNALVAGSNLVADHPHSRVSPLGFHNPIRRVCILE